jgi:hypothetical protein
LGSSQNTFNLNGVNGAQTVGFMWATEQTIISSPYTAIVYTTAWYPSNVIDVYPAGGGRQYGAITSMDNDGFTIDWKKDGSPASGTINVIYVAFP